MPRASLVLAAVAVACLAAVTEAQSVAPLRLGVALGASVPTSAHAPLGSHGVLSLTSHRPDSRLGIRVEAFFDGGHRVYRNVQGLSVTRRQKTFGLTVNPVYRLLGNRRGLYVIAGLGVYHRVDEYEPAFSDEVQRWTVTELALNAGLGIDFRAFGHDMFVESRLHTDPFADRVPVTIGIRF